MLRRVHIEATFGKLSLFVTDGHQPYPYGHEMTGYEVSSLSDTVAKAEAEAHGAWRGGVGRAVYQRAPRVGDGGILGQLRGRDPRRGQLLTS